MSTELSKSIQELCILFLLLLCKFECQTCFYFNGQYVICSNRATFLKIDSHSGPFCLTSVTTHKQILICTNYLIQLNILNRLKTENTKSRIHKQNIIKLSLKANFQMYLHAIANSKNRLANSEYCWIKPGSIFCIHRIRSSRDDNSTVELSKRVSEKSLIANFYTKSTDSASLCFWYIVDI